MSALSLQAQTVYVTPEGAGQQTGADWANALPGSQLQATLASAIEGAEFRLAGGAYKPSNTGDRMLSFSIPSGVKVLGGYLGSGANPDQRIDFATTDQPGSTTLSGDIDNDNLLDAENSNIVVQFANVSAQTLLDGVVITGGYATAPIYFTNSVGGGAIYNNGYRGASSPTVQNCVFSQNYTSGMGGAIFNDGSLRGNSSPVFTNCRFLNNRANEGGAIYNRAFWGTTKPAFTNCSFLNNSASSGGALYNYAEGDRFSGGPGISSPFLVNCVLQGNTASTSGGAMFNTTLGNDYPEAKPTLVNCSLVDNSSPQGGAFYNTATPYMINGSQFTAGPTLFNSLLWNNGGSKAIVNITYVNRAGGTSTGNGLVYFYNCLGEPGVNDSPKTDPKAQIITSSPFVSVSNLQLNPCSPAINTGNTSYYTDRSSQQTDIAGNPRIAGGTIDIGAFEFQGTPATLLAITRQPASQSTVVAGATVETTVGLNAPADSYAWYKDGSLVTGQSSATLRLTNVQPQQAGSYSLVATSACNSVTSTAFSLSVTQPVAQPPLVSATSSQSALCVGSTTGLTAQATGGTAPYTYQWSSASPGVLTNPTASAVIFTATSAGVMSVSVVVTDANNLTDTASVSLLVNAKPVVSIDGLASTYSQTDPAITLAGVGTPTGGTFTLDGNLATVFEPASLSLGLHQVGYTFTDGNGCSNATSQSVTINPAPVTMTLTRFWLINADTDQPIQELTAGTQLNLSSLPTRNLNIQAVTVPAVIGSVAFSLSGQQSYQVVEGVAPYALFGDNQGDYLGWTPALGAYTLTATPYAQAGGTGTAGTALTVSFTVINQASTSQQLTHFWLVNADTDQPIQELTAGTQLNLSSLPTRNLNIQAVTEPAAVGSVAFNLSGQQSYQVVEGVAPYALFGDNQGDYLGWTPAVGTYTLTATPYAGANATGAIGTALTVDFTVVKQPGNQRVTHFWLINADTDQPIEELTDGQEVDLSRLPTRNLNIQAVTEPAVVGSVVFELSGQQSRQMVEGVAPYALFGDNQGDYANWTPDLGPYTLTATPYSGGGGTDTAGLPRQVSFLVTNPGAARLAAGRGESSVEGGWQVRVLGNPVTGSEVVVEVSGAQGQPLVYTLTDASGRQLDARTVAGPGALERQTLQAGSAGTGLLLLQVSSPIRHQTIKVLKAN
ncbi:hypothetical protein GCM10027185_25910 [Spirosoma pulveris]